MRLWLLSERYAHLHKHVSLQLLVVVEQVAGGGVSSLPAHVARHLRLAAVLGTVAIDETLTFGRAGQALLLLVVAAGMRCEHAHVVGSRRSLLGTRGFHVFVGLLLQQAWGLLLVMAGKHDVAVAALMSVCFHSVTRRRSGKGRRSDGALDHFTDGLVQVGHGRHRLLFSHRAAGSGGTLLLLLNNGHRRRGVVVVKVVC